jgi:8-oxo-dGTP diphosphatase
VPDYITTIRAKIGHDLLLMPAVAAIVRNEAGEILLQKRADNGKWCLPGGMVEPGEEPAQAVVRETLEETGLVVEPVSVSGVYGGPSLMGQYPNGDRYAYIGITFACRVAGGAPLENLETHEETRDLAWFPPRIESLPELMVEPHRQRLIHYLSGGPLPYFVKP